MVGNNIVNVKNSSAFWWDTEGEQCATYFLFKFNEESTKFVENNAAKFIESFTEIALKYKILIPLFTMSPDYVWNIDHASRFINNFMSLYNPKRIGIDGVKYYIGSNLIFPSQLYINDDLGNIKLATLIDITKLNTFEDFLDSTYESIDFPLQFSCTGGDNYFSLGVCFWNDCFYPYLFSNNAKQYALVNYDNRLDLKNKIIDNSNLAWLNTPRVNSFIKSFKKLCEEYGGVFMLDTGYKQSEIEPKLVNEAGILLGNEIIYYEDIVNLLEDKYKIQDFTQR